MAPDSWEFPTGEDTDASSGERPPAPPSQGAGAPPPAAWPPQQPPPGGQQGTPPSSWAPAPGPEGYPPPQYAYPPPPPDTSAGRPWTIAGLVCAIIALVFFPIILGPVGAVFGFKGNAKGDPKGQLVGYLAIGTTIVGMIIAAMVYNSMNANT